MKEYIERDLLKNMLLRDIDHCYEKGITSDYMKGYHNGLTMAYAMVIGMFDAADVVERVRGEWKYYWEGKELMCSVCKTTFWDENGTGGTNYCPNCGADMRKDEA